MLNSEDSKKSLVKLFQKHFVVDIQQLSNRLNTSSRMSIFRRLRRVGYHSSYTHKGAYYTLTDIPHFDKHGLWFFHGIGFSQANTLKATIIELVERSEAGYTHREIEALLHIRVHNSLLGLVRAQSIVRKPINKHFVYCSSDQQKATDQTTKRIKLFPVETESSAPLSETMIIEVLIEIVNAGEVLISPTAVTERLLARQISITTRQVEQIFTHYGLDVEKKILHSTS